MLLFVNEGFAQTANIQAGCVPLIVNFSAPVGTTTFFWDFKNGATSNIQNPTNTFNNPGTYHVEFKESVSGPIVGTVTIQVFAKPEMGLSFSTPNNGCAPHNIAVQALPITPSGINATGYNWTFGNGQAASGVSVSNTYTSPGSYGISIELLTNMPSCNTTFVFPDTVNVVAPPIASFSTNPNPPLACVAPLNVTFLNSSTSSQPLTYSWNFGNGNTSTLVNPPIQTYTNVGDYTVNLIVENAYGCQSFQNRVVSIGNPTSSFDIPDTVCINQTFTAINTSSAGNYVWNFGSNAMPQFSNSLQPNVTFTQGGIQTISLTTSSTNGTCFDTYTTTIYVEDIQVSFTANPTYSCSQPLSVTFNGNANTNIVNWNWDFGDLNFDTTQNTSHTYQVNSSPYSNNNETIFSPTLTVTSASGCTASTFQEIIISLPGARFMPDVVSGCLPLEVTFSDSSSSNEAIVSWEWHYGDGNSVIFNNDSSHNYTFNNVGEYDVFLIIENSAGCIDTSGIITIYVGDELNLDFAIDKNSVCPGEEVVFTNLSPDSALVTSWHYSSNGELLSHHCFQDDSPILSFNNVTGFQDITLTAEYNGCYSTKTYQSLIEVKGPIAKFTMEQDCASPFEARFLNISGDATSVSWDFGDGSTSTEAIDTIVHTYTSPGDYQVILTAYNNSSGCAESKDTAIIYIRDLKANFTIDSLMCGGVSYPFSASGSTGVHADCGRGYTWIFSQNNKRPYTSASPFNSFVLDDSGVHTIKLKVVDINGCRDTLSKEVQVFNLNANYTVNQQMICFPSEVEFQNLSTSDTGIVSYSWNFGNGNFSTDENTTHNYTSGGNSFLTSLSIVDEIGCQSTFNTTISVYQPFSNIFITPNNTNVCAGDEILFTAPDFTSQGSNLQFEWDFGDSTLASGNGITHAYSQSGQFTVTLEYTEISTGCSNTVSRVINVQDYPTAGFLTSIDNLPALCAPQIINFQDTSVSSSPITITEWDFGIGNVITGSSPSHTFDKGIHEIVLIVSTSFGCADTINKLMTVIGPEGDFTIDRNTICQGEEIVFTMIDTFDVHSFTWDFGDGNTIDNISPVSYPYNFIPPSGQTIAQLIVFGENGYCPFATSQDIFIHEVIADYTRNNDIDTVSCIGDPVVFVNLSQNADFFVWDLGNGSTSNSAGTFSYSYNTAGTYEIKLVATNLALGCKDSISKEIIVVEPVPVFASGDTACFGSTAQLSVDNPNLLFDYIWTPSSELNNAQIHNPTLTATNSETYLVTSTDTNGCKSSALASIFVVPLITEIQFDTAIVVGDSIILPGNVTSDMTFSWSPEEGLSCTECPNPTIAPLEDVEYELYMEDIYGCFDGISSYTVRIIPETNVKLPTTFSPNGDGVNDVIYVKGWGIKKLLLFEIYNRWGELIFQTNDINVGWDGYHKGVLQNNDVYVYLVKVETWLNEELTTEGHINLMR
jgi:gliding motility-associated-like protein